MLGRPTGSAPSIDLRIVHHPPETMIRGQESLILQSSAVRVAIAKQGAMLAPVEFFPDAPDAFSPYAIAPWAEDAALQGATVNVRCHLDFLRTGSLPDPKDICSNA